MRINVVLFLILIGQVNVFSQEFSISFDVGYGFKIATESFGEGLSSSINQYENEIKVVKFSYGRGINLNSGIEYWSKKNIGFGLELGYLKGLPVNRVYYRTDLVNNVIFSGRMFRISPSMKLKIEKDKIQYYSRFGYLLGFLGELNRRRVYIDFTGVGGSSIENVRYNKGLSHGITAGFGLNYKIYKRISLNFEVRAFVQSYGPGKKEVIDRMINGEDRLSDLQPGEIHVNYVNSYIRQNTSGGIDLSEPLTSLKRMYPFSSAGINFGLSYKLRK